MYRVWSMRPALIPILAGIVVAGCGPPAVDRAAAPDDSIPEVLASVLLGWSPERRDREIRS